MTWDMSEKDRPTAFVDVDNTLLLWPGPVGGGYPKINWPLVDALRTWKTQTKGVVYLWSFGGATHCRAAVIFAKIHDLVDGCVGKPSCIIDDDQAWLGARTTKFLPGDFK